MAEFVVAFDRIGRSRDVPPLHTPIAKADRVAEAVWRYARNFLGSRDYVDVRLPTDGQPGSVAIGWGRYGSGTITIEGSS